MKQNKRLQSEYSTNTLSFYDKLHSLLSSLSKHFFTLSSSGPTREYIGQRNHYYGFSGRKAVVFCRRMTESGCHSGHSYLCHSGLRAGIQRGDINMTGCWIGSSMTGMECGRSMVEMLGTLAIIGVLSIGGIAGYSYGMDKYRANTIINDIMLRATDILAKDAIPLEENLPGWPTTTAGKYAIGLEEGTTGIQVSGLPKRLCEMLAEGMENAAEIKIGATYVSESETVDCGDINTMTFYVDAEEEIIETEIETETPATEETTTTEATATPIETTTPEITTTWDGRCSSNAECQAEDACMGCIIPDGQETGVCEYACQELEYLESDGGQYIDTGVNGTSNSKWEVDFQSSKQVGETFQSIFGAQRSNERLSTIIIGANTATRFVLRKGASVSISDQDINFTNIADSNSRHIYGIDIKNFTAYVDDNSITGSTVDGLTTPISVYILARNDNGTASNFAKGKLYGAKIYNNADLLRNFIPVLDPEEVPAMLDTVENKLYYNQGSGKFTYGE